MVGDSTGKLVGQDMDVDADDQDLLRAVEEQERAMEAKEGVKEKGGGWTQGEAWGKGGGKGGQWWYGGKGEENGSWGKGRGEKGRESHPGGLGKKGGERRATLRATVREQDREEGSAHAERRREQQT